MANVLERQILIDGWRNAVVQFVGAIDTADPVVVPALALSEFVNNDAQLVLQGLRLKNVTWSLGAGLELTLEWNAADPQKIVELSRTGSLDACHYGGIDPDLLRPGYDGAINLRTRSFAPGTTAGYTVVAEFVKMYRR